MKSEYKKLATQMHGIPSVPTTVAEVTDTAGLMLLSETIIAENDDEWIDGDAYFGVGK